VKDLSKLGRPLSDVILVDNSPLSSLFQPENALTCSTWYEDKNDRELLQLIPILEKLARVPDVRAVIPLLKKEEGETLHFERAREVLGIPEPLSTARKQHNSQK
jgi:TFIIF-interacting CTD phosphatase-like protein